MHDAAPLRLDQFHEGDPHRAEPFAQRPRHLRRDGGGIAERADAVLQFGQEPRLFLPLAQGQLGMTRSVTS